MYRKIAKWLFWIMAIISVAIVVWGSSVGFSSDGGVAVDVLLRWAYILLIASVVLVILLGIVLNLVNDPKSLVKTGLGILVIVVVACIAYATASGSPLVGYLGVQPSGEELKLTDTLLNLVYILGAVAILSVVVGEIIGTIRNK